MSRHANQVCPNAITDAQQVEQRRRAYGNRGTENHGAHFTSNNEPHGMDLPPALNKMICRQCGNPVQGLHCENCETRAAGR